MRNQDGDTNEDDFTELESELQTTRQSFESFIGRRLMMWAIRWTIGFAIIAAVVYYYPDLSWLWWAGAAIAALSLVLLVGGHFFMQRKFNTADDKLQKMKEEIAKLEEEEG